LVISSVGQVPSLADYDHQFRLVTTKLEQGLIFKARIRIFLRAKTPFLFLTKNILFQKSWFWIGFHKWIELGTWLGNWIELAVNNQFQSRLLIPDQNQEPELNFFKNWNQNHSNLFFRTGRTGPGQNYRFHLCVEPEPEPFKLIF
jgi:hypothetical protein